jgi:pancreatic triacylglycerol lipase
MSAGLDPAGPYFRGMPPFACLDPSDALFVDAVHTDGGFLGTSNVRFSSRPIRH